MMTEALIDVLDENGNPTGVKKNKAGIHEGGYWHNAAWVWIYNSKGEVLLQKRSKNKDSHPGLWDISAAGHVDSGEEPVEAAIREIREEISIDVNPEDLKFIKKRVSSSFNKDNGWQNNEFDYVYLYKWDGRTDDLVVQDDEVERMQFIPLKQFLEETSHSEKSRFYVPHGKHYKEVATEIQKEIDAL